MFESRFRKFDTVSRLNPVPHRYVEIATLRVRKNVDHSPVFHCGTINCLMGIYSSNLMNALSALENRIYHSKGFHRFYRIRL